MAKTKYQAAQNPETTPQELFNSDELLGEAYYSDAHSLVFHADALDALEVLAIQGLMVDCIVTSPPFYGQRDYEVEGQIGLELDPNDYIDKLVEVFSKCRDVLKETGSLWVNLGDTYWSGKGQHRSDEPKQSARRFGLRPQDRSRDSLWTRPKQLLLIPHRFAIAMQDTGWLVRNDNVWVKPNPIPDQVGDRCSRSHEYVFHFARERYYYFDKSQVGRPSRSGTMMPPNDTWYADLPDTWIVPTSRGDSNHKATYSEELVEIPILATTPEFGVVLDPFAGSGTTLEFSRKKGLRSIGIDIKEEFCFQMSSRLKELDHAMRQESLWIEGGNE